MPVYPPPGVNPSDAAPPLPREPRPPRARFQVERRAAWLTGDAEPTALTTARITITGGGFPNAHEWRRLIREIRDRWHDPVLFGPKRRRQDELLDGVLATHGDRPPRGHGLMDYWKKVHRAANAACARESVPGWKTWTDVRRFVIRRERAFHRAEARLEADMQAHEEELRRRGVRFR
jgi:hypothetical protein